MSSASASQSLQGKIAIVTGSSRGIGAGIAWELAQRGAKVVVSYTAPGSEILAEEVVSKIDALGNGASAIKVQADLRKVEAAEQIVEATRAAFGDHIDILVNNAGTGVLKGLEDTSVEDFAYVHDLNVRAIFLMTKAVLPHLRTPGRIINIGSIASRTVFPKFFAYSSSKAAVEGMTRSWAADLGHSGTTVNCVNPGTVVTELMDALPPGFVDAQNKRTPLENRTGTVDDIAQIVAFLAEEGSRWLTGQCLSASGGLAVY